MAGVHESADWSTMEERVSKIRTLLEEIQPRLERVIHPNRISFKDAVTQVMCSSSTSELPEQRLAETMTKNGQSLGADSLFGQALVDYGGAMSQMAAAREEMGGEVVRDVLDPIRQLEKGDLKQVTQHVKTRDNRQNELQQQRQKLQRKQGKNVPFSEDEVRVAQEKYEEASELTRSSVANFLDTEAEQIALLKRFVEAQLQHHGRSVQILENLDQDLQNRKRQAEERPKKAYRPKKIFGRNEGLEDDSDDDNGDRNSLTGKLRMSDERQPANAHEDEEMTQRLDGRTTETEDIGDVPLQGENLGDGGSVGIGYCVAVYDFVKENEADLGLKSGDVVEILERVDENWLRGRKENDAATGLFPKAFVKEN